MNRQNTLSVESSRPWCQRFHPLTWKGFGWAAVLPGLGVFLFYALVLNVRLRLGRWPNFGEHLPTPLLSFHFHCVWRFAQFLWVSLYAVPILVIASLCFRRSRHIAVYIFTYGIFVALAGSSILLAPHEFLNWFFD